MIELPLEVTSPLGQPLPRWPRLEAIRRIAVLRAGGLGDLIFALPALWSLRRAYPASAITLVGSSWQGELLAGHTDVVDDVVPVPADVLEYLEGRRSLEDPALRPFLQRMRGSRFDLALQWHGGGRQSNPFVRAFGAGLTAGLRAHDAPRLHLSAPYRYYQSEASRILDAAALVGVPPSYPQPLLSPLPLDLAEAAAALEGIERPYVAVAPGAGDPRRRWPVERFARAAARVEERTGASIVALGDVRDVNAGQTVAGAVLRGRSLAGRTTLSGLVGVLAGASLVLGNDSGPLHLATAIGRPTVGIFWCGNLINAGPASRLRHRPLLSWRLACPVCGLDCTSGRCDHRESFVADVPVEAVVEEAVELLGAREDPSATVASEADTALQASAR